MVQGGLQGTRVAETGGLQAVGQVGIWEGQLQAQCSERTKTPRLEQAECLQEDSVAELSEQRRVGGMRLGTQPEARSVGLRGMWRGL